MSYIAKTPEGLLPCPFCGGEAHVYRQGEGPAVNSLFAYNIECDHLPECPISESGDVVGDLDACSDDLDKLKEAWNRRAERTWHDFADELPPVGSVVLCRGKNGALYVGKPVTFNGNGTRKVWVPRGDQYRTPEKWVEVSE